MLDGLRRAEIRQDLDDKKEDANAFAKKNRTRVAQIWRANREKADREGLWSERPTETLVLLAKFSNSAQVQSHLQAMQTDFASKFKRGQWSSHFVRDFLMAHLLVHGGGHRTDVVRGVTLGEWQQAQTVKNKFGTEVKVIHVHHHKTFKTYSTAELAVADLRVCCAIQSYVDFVRPEFVAQSVPAGNPNDPSLTLFLGRFGKKIPQILGGPWDYVKSILRLEGISEKELKVFRPKDIRGAVAEFGSSCADPSIRNSIPNLLCHSQAVHDTRYLRNSSLKSSNLSHVFEEGLVLVHLNLPALEESSKVNPNSPTSVPSPACFEDSPTAAAAGEAPKSTMNDSYMPILTCSDAESLEELMRQGVQSPDVLKKATKVHFDKQQKSIILARFKSHMISQKEIKLQCDTDAEFRTFWHVLLSSRNLNPAQGAKALRSFLTNRLVGRKK